MDSFIINQSEIKVNKTFIEWAIDEYIIEVNETYHNQLKNVFRRSKGDYVNKMKLQMEEEYKMVSELASLYKEILQYMEEAADQAVQLDQLYTTEKVQWGK